MKTTRFARRTVLTIGIALALLMSAAQGPAMAGHGYKMEQQPHLGDSQPASGEAAASASTGEDAHAQATAEARPSDWKRSDLPHATHADRDDAPAQ